MIHMFRYLRLGHTRARCLSRRFPGLVLLTAALVFIGGAANPAASASTKVATAQADDYQPLRRPLDLPRVRADDECPSSEPRRVVAGVVEMLGSAPIYVTGGGARGILQFEYPPSKNTEFAGSGWGGQKVLWAIGPAYRGPILIRARRLDGPEQVRFNGGSSGPATSELRLPANTTSAAHASSPKGWRYFPSYTRLRASGCYAYQVDGTSFSHTIVFRAEAWLPLTRGLGERGCRPPSPLGAFGRDLPESAGNVSRASVWALFFPPGGTTLAGRHRAKFTNLTGKNMKIAFRVAGSGLARFTAIAPDGSTHTPTNRPRRRLRSSWDRPGDEWRMTFRFGQPGCWRLHVSRGGGTGDIWLIAD